MPSIISIADTDSTSDEIVGWWMDVSSEGSYRVLGWYRYNEGEDRPEPPPYPVMIDLTQKSEGSNDPDELSVDSSILSCESEGSEWFESDESSQTGER